MKNLLNNRDFVSGVCFVVAGLFVAHYAFDRYTIGTLSRMGPGFFPIILGVGLAIIGSVIVLLSLNYSDLELELTFGWRPIVAVSLAIWVFSQMVGKVGLIPSVLILTLIAGGAEKQFVLRRSLWLGCSLGAIAWLIFIVGLGLNIPAFIWAF